MIETLPPLLAAGLRFATAGIIVFAGLWLWARIRGERQPLERPSLLHWRSAAIVGVLLLLGGNGGVVLAEQTIPSGIAAVVIATLPIWLAVFDGFVTRRLPNLLVVGGLVAGIIGVAVLLVPVGGVGELDPVGIGLLIGAEISWAIGSLYSRHAPLPRSGLML